MQHRVPWSGSGAADRHPDCRMFYEQFYDLLLDDPDTVRRKICAVLQPALRAFAEQQGVEPEALAATLIVFAADDTGRYLCAHLGDGCILMQPSARRQPHFQRSLPLPAGSRRIPPI